MQLYTKFWGARGSLPTPGPLTSRYGGNTPCVEIRTEKTTIIVDAGSGLRNFGQDLLRRHPVPVARPADNPSETPGHTVHLLLSHTHWDHIQGFPFFTPAYLPSTRFHIYDLEESAGRFYSLLSGQMTSEYFPIRFSDLKAKIISETIADRKTVIGDITVRAFPHLRHPGGSIAYSFETKGAKVVYASDNELDQMLLAPGRDSEPGDLRTTLPAFVEFVQGADLLIADAQYTDDEYPNRVGWGHASARTVTDLAIAARIKRLALFHHDPSRSDSDLDGMVADCATWASRHGSSVAVFAAREGVELADGVAESLTDWS